MAEKHRRSGFKALLDSHKTNSHYMVEHDGSLRLWRDLSAESRLEYIARDAALYEVPFEQFAQAVRESVDNAAIEEAALRLAMRSVRELYEVEKRLPDFGRTDSPPLVDQVEYLVRADISGEKHEAVLSGKQMTILLEELRTAAAKRADNDGQGKESNRKMPAAKDKGIER